MSIFSIAICDDEGASCLQLNDMVMSHKDSSNFLIKVFNSGEELWEYIRVNEFVFELIILDIRLHELNGVDVGKLLRGSELGRQSEILYVSSDESYAMQLFDIHPLNFIIKPINKAKLLRNIDRAMQLKHSSVKTFSFTFERAVHNIPLDEILYFEAITKTINIHLCNGESRYFYGKIDEIKNMLKTSEFIKIHHSFLVNWNHIKICNAENLIMDNGMLLNISRLNKKDVQAYAKSRLGKE